jgi:hypothetical protein
MIVALRSLMRKEQTMKYKLIFNEKEMQVNPIILERRSYVLDRDNLANV